MPKMLQVSEIFGPTVQGEGASIGMPTMFLRLGGCNLTCKWCDTPYTWDWTGLNGKKYDPRVEVHPMSEIDVVETLVGSPVRRLVVTGGEPMLQAEAVERLTRTLRSSGWWVELETNGTIAPHPELADQFNVSPKLSNSGVAFSLRNNFNALHFLASLSKTVWKFVVTSPEDFEEIDQLVADHGMKRVYVMPEGIKQDDLEERMQLIVSSAISRGYYVTPRLHIQLFGNVRGV